MKPETPSAVSSALGMAGPAKKMAKYLTPPAPRPAEIRILLAGDHLLFREGLRRLLEAESDLRVVGETAGTDDTLAMVIGLEPDVLLFDLTLARARGIEMLARLAELRPVRTIVLAQALDKAEIIKALQHGVRGVLLKDTAAPLLFKSIRLVMAGEYWIGRSVVSDMAATLAQTRPRAEERVPSRSFGLTVREQQVVALVVAGLTNRDIAQKLAVAEDTVKHHLTSVFDKTGASNRLELALFALHHQVPHP